MKRSSQPAIPLSAGKDAPLSFKARLLAAMAVALMRVFELTYRWRYVDESGVIAHPPDRPMIWVLWHNRIFALRRVHRRCLPTRNGAILTSVSGDGDIIAAVVKIFGIYPVRGSTSRRGAAALLNLREWVRAGFDVLIIPDGPRGPRYRFGPGAIKLAELTGAMILPIRIEFGSAWSFRGWDHFRLPKPFTTVTAIIGPCLEIPPDLSEDDFETERQRVERVLNPDHEID